MTGLTLHEYVVQGNGCPRNATSEPSISTVGRQRDGSAARPPFTSKKEWYLRSDQVVELFLAFASADVRAWLAGGWAVDAIVGRQTRAHLDMDVAVDARDLHLLLHLLDERGFVVTTDWAPSRLELTASDGRVVDVHPVTFGPDGSGRQVGLDGEVFHYEADGFATGTIDGSATPCLSVTQQLSFRAGYEHRSIDTHDIELLERFR